jgi:hypothetical protein
MENAHFGLLMGVGSSQDEPCRTTKDAGRELHGRDRSYIQSTV